MSKSGTTASFKYNENGLRVQKTVNGVTTDYTLHGKNIIHMKQGSNKLHFFYDASNKPAVVVYNGTAYSYIKNLQGDIVAILNSAGTAVVRYTYDAWGKPISCTGTMSGALGALNPFRYRSYIYDEETGLYYLRSRYYNPSWCRTVNTDAVIGSGVLISHNLFCYCLNVPVLGKDSDGFSFQDYWNDFVADAAAFASATWDGMAQRANALIENPNVDTFLNWATMGLTHYNYDNALTMIEEPTLYNVANYLTMGIPDAVSGAISPEEPLSFNHWLSSIIVVGGARMASPYVRSVAHSSTLWFMGLNKGKALTFCNGHLKIYYATPHVGGGVIMSYKRPGMQFRFDCDKAHFLHMHYGTGKKLKIHRPITVQELKDLIEYIKEHR